MDGRQDVPHVQYSISIILHRKISYQAYSAVPQRVNIIKNNSFFRRSLQLIFVCFSTHSIYEVLDYLAKKVYYRNFTLLVK